MDIRKLLGLTPEATDEEVAAAATEWQRDREVAVAAREALSLETGADGAAVRTAVASAQGSAGTGSDPDPAQYVPRTQYDELVVRVAGLESQRSSEGAERAVASAVEAGSIAPSPARVGAQLRDVGSRGLPGLCQGGAEDLRAGHASGGGRCGRGRRATLRTACGAEPSAR